MGRRWKKEKSNFIKKAKRRSEEIRKRKRKIQKITD